MEKHWAELIQCIHHNKRHLATFGRSMNSLHTSFANFIVNMRIAHCEWASKASLDSKQTQLRNMNIVFIYSTSINQQRNEWHNIKWDAFFAPNYPFVGHIYCQWDAKFQYFKLTNFQQLEREPEWMAAVNETISILVSAASHIALWWNVMSSARLGSIKRKVSTSVLVTCSSFFRFVSFRSVLYSRGKVIFHIVVTSALCKYRWISICTSALHPFG